MWCWPQPPERPAGAGGQCEPLWLTDCRRLGFLTSAFANDKRITIYPGNVKALWGGRPSVELDRQAPEQPVTDALEGLLRLPVHGAQNLREHPQEGQPEA